MIIVVVDREERRERLIKRGHLRSPVLDCFLGEERRRSGEWKGKERKAKERRGCQLEFLSHISYIFFPHLSWWKEERGQRGSFLIIRRLLG